MEIVTKLQKIQIALFRKSRNNIEFLLLKANKKRIFWQGVTGGVESYDKDLKHAVVRELKEELNIDAKPEQVIGPLHQFDFITSRKGFEGQITNEQCFGFQLLKDYEVQLSKEHNEYRWLPYEEAYKLIDYKNPKKVIKIINSMFG